MKQELDKSNEGERKGHMKRTAVAKICNEMSTVTAGRCPVCPPSWITKCINKAGCSLQWGPCVECPFDFPLKDDDD